MSDVTAVQKAREAQKSAEDKAKTDMEACRADAKRKINETVAAQKEAVRKAGSKIKAARKNEKMAWGSLMFTLLCCLINSPTFLNDITNFFMISIGWAWDMLSDYAGWMVKPYYTEFVEGVEKRYAFSIGWAWILRILSVGFILICIAGACYGVYRLWQYYRKRWCNLSKRVFFASLGAIIVFGENIRSYMNTNLVLLIVIVQLAYLGILIYLDWYFESRQRLDTWIRVQNS